MSLGKECVTQTHEFDRADVWDKIHLSTTSDLGVIGERSLERRLERDGESDRGFVQSGYGGYVSVLPIDQSIQKATTVVCHG